MYPISSISAGKSPSYTLNPRFQGRKLTPEQEKLKTDKTAFELALAAHGGSIQKLSEAVKITRQGLYKWAGAHGIECPGHVADPQPIKHKKPKKVRKKPYHGQNDHLLSAKAIAIRDNKDAFNAALAECGNSLAALSRTTGATKLTLRRWRANHQKQGQSMSV